MNRSMTRAVRRLGTNAEECAGREVRGFHFAGEVNECHDAQGRVQARNTYFERNGRLCVQMESFDPALGPRVASPTVGADDAGLLDCVKTLEKQLAAELGSRADARDAIRTMSARDVVVAVVERQRRREQPDPPPALNFEPAAPEGGKPNAHGIPAPPELRF